MPEQLTLPYGANQYVIPGLRAAWGCRLIVSQDGYVDFVPDRQGGAVLNDTDPEHRRLLDATMEWVRAGAADRTFDNIRKILREGRMSTRQRQGWWIYEDDRGLMICNTNASAGYCYVIGWIYAALPEGHTTKGAEILVEELTAARDTGGG